MPGTYRVTTLEPPLSMTKRSEIPALVAQRMGISLLEAQITDATNLTGEVADRFLDEIERLPVRSLKRYQALGALTRKGKLLGLAQAERLCRLFCLYLPDGVIIPNASFAAGGMWLDRAQNNFDSLVAFLNWSHSHAEKDTRFAVLRMYAARRLTTSDRTLEQLKLLYTQTFVEPTFSEQRDDVFRMWETAALIAIDKHGDHMGNLLEEMVTFPHTPAVREKCVQLCTSVLVREHEAYT